MMFLLIQFSPCESIDYSPQKWHHLLHYVLAEGYDNKQFLWEKEEMWTQDFRQWFNSEHYYS